VRCLASLTLFAALLSSSDVVADEATRFVFRWFGLPVGEAEFQFANARYTTGRSDQLMANSWSSQDPSVAGGKASNAQNPSLREWGRRLEGMAQRAGGISDRDFLSIEPLAGSPSFAISFWSNGLVRWLRPYRAVVRQSFLTPAQMIYQSTALDRGERELRLIEFTTDATQGPRVLGFVDRDRVEPLRLHKTDIHWSTPLDALAAFLSDVFESCHYSTTFHVFDGKRVYLLEAEEVKNPSGRDSSICLVEDDADKQTASIELVAANEASAQQVSRSSMPVLPNLPFEKQLHIKMEPLSLKTIAASRIPGDSDREPFEHAGPPETVEERAPETSRRLWPFNQAVLESDIWVMSTNGEARFSRIEVNTPFGKVIGLPINEALNP
jgi:hypothetical protein